MDNSNRKASTAQIILKNITQERDSAVSQLGVAYFAIEQLKVENEGLKGENNELKTRLGLLRNAHQNETQKWTADEEALQRKFDRRTEAVRSMTAESGVQASELQDMNVAKPRHNGVTERNVESSAHKEANNMFNLHPTGKDEPSKGGQRTVQIDESEESEDSVYEAPEAKGKGKDQSSRSTKNAQGETSQNLTYLSFLEVKNPLMLCYSR